MPRSEVRQRPTLLNSCAWAATSAEAAFRIDAPEMMVNRSSRVIALDERAGEIVRGMAGGQWSGGHFLVFDAVVPPNGAGGPPTDATLRTASGEGRTLADELTDADAVVMVATEHASPDAAAVIGDACADRMIMTVGLVAAAADEIGPVLTALRPNAMVLVILKNDDDIPEILTALRV